MHLARSILSILSPPCSAVPPACLAALLLAAGCGDDLSATGTASATATAGSTGAGSTSQGTSADTSAGTTAGSDGGTGSSTGSAGTGVATTDAKFDVGWMEDVPAPTTGGEMMNCKVQDDMDAVGACGQEAPPDSFDPEIQWTWQGPPDSPYSWVTPHVANLTDDNDDGEIDLCDTPDVVVVTFLEGGAHAPGTLHLLDGASGQEHMSFSTPVHNTCEPAIGDIDGDGVPEIVTCSPYEPGVGSHLIALEHDGALKWEAEHTWVGFPINFGTAVALADLDNDGDVEIIANDLVVDHDGHTVFVTGEATTPHSATAAADLDGDGDLEVVVGRSAYHHDGSVYYLQNGIAPGYPQIADLDDDPEPEVLVTNQDGISLLEHDGAIKYKDLKPTGDGGGPNTWNRPATVHDFDGDGVAEYALSSQDHYTVYERDASIVWSATVNDLTGIAAGTAFDFLGDGVAEAMYADESRMYVYDGAGAPLLDIPRTSLTVVEYPVVVDVDNDGSAEIVIVSAYPKDPNDPASPTVQVIRDAEDRWIQARRIWNQHTYHVTNVREDGTIPTHETPSWTQLNTFRTNAQIEGGGVCLPDPPE